jgi:KUP system potassium uptake protein
MSHSDSNNKLLPLMIGAIGVVFGDIGTSPLYAIKECFNGPHGLDLTRENGMAVCR